ncbi:hypothetical protein [Vibrio fluvialis]|uniref:hypothetical protein n=1 Tax=Vibrio fluvialis TaxID=676 RepID=UPI00192AB715|nr:hypothetical protein [Vibrio fluvialis]MBL4262815.1 hypothetical protein [Vibrio fluvialis]
MTLAIQLERLLCKSEIRVYPPTQSVKVERFAYMALFERQGVGKVLYSGERKGLCLGEYFVDKYLSDEVKSGVFLFRIKRDTFYFAVAEDFCITSEKLISEDAAKKLHENFPYEVNVGAVFCSEQLFEDVIILEKFVLKDIPLRYFTTDELRLEKARKRKLLVTASVTFLLLIVSSLIGYRLFIYQVPVKVIYNDPYSAYKNDIRGQVKAEVAINQVKLIFAKLMFLPKGISFSAVTMQNGSVDVSLKNSGVEMKVLEFWMKDQGLDKFYSDGKITVPLDGYNEPWIKMIVPISNVASEISDSSTLLGLNSEVGNVVLNKNYRQQTVSIKSDSQELAVLEVIEDLVSDKPVFVSKIDVNPLGGNGKIKVDISMSVKGE